MTWNDDSLEKSIIFPHNNSETQANCYAKFHNEDYDADLAKHLILLDDSDSNEGIDLKEAKKSNLFYVSDLEYSDA